MNPCGSGVSVLAGIRVRGSSSILVEYNEVAFSPYGGILVGWQAGGSGEVQANPPPPLACQV
jgi:hypothetical protein